MEPGRGKLASPEVLNASANDFSHSRSLSGEERGRGWLLGSESELMIVGPGLSSSLSVISNTCVGAGAGPGVGPGPLSFPAIGSSSSSSRTRIAFDGL